MRARLLNARLLKLLALLRTSGEIRYGREIDLTELHRRVVSLVGNFDGLTSVELVALTGQEKAQISRAVAALSAQHLVARASLRAPVLLTPAGRAIYANIMAIGGQRNAAVTHAISPSELDRFAATTERLTERAAQLLAQEREIDTAVGAGDAPNPEDVLDTSPMPERLQRMARQRALGRMVAPPLITLSAYLSRSATIAYRRETGLSSFTWRVLSQIGEHQPITLATLIGLVHRDKSQVGRAVKWLEEERFIDRTAVHKRRDVMLACTPKGDTLYAGMCVSARQRDDFLFEGFAPVERLAYLATIERLTENSEALLARERAEGEAPPRP